ncbi:MAG: NPXTG-anchored protein [Bacteroides sp.]|nr:NPXTG-anchored protein [Bacteroides sp.]
MKASKIISVLSASAVAAGALCSAAFAETITMADAGYGINGGKSFFPDDITAYSSTLGDLADHYDTIDFTISVADLGGRDDLLFQVYVSAGDWAVWANGDETPAISEANTDYSFSLNVDEIAEAHGREFVICDMGFQILSATPGDVDVTYSVSYSANGSAANNEEETVSEPAPESAETENTASDSDNTIGASADVSDDKGSPDTGIAGISACFAAAVISASAILVLKKRK